MKLTILLCVALRLRILYLHSLTYPEDVVLKEQNAFIYMSCL